jgi:hypothetical protein
MTENQGFVLSTDPEMWPEFDVIQDTANGTSLEVLLTEFESTCILLNSEEK